MVARDLVADRFRLDGAEQRSRRRDIARRQAKVDDLAYGGIAQQFVRYLHGDLYRRFCRALVALDVALELCVRAIGGRPHPPGAVGRGTADFTDSLCRSEIPARRLDRLVPDFLARGPVEPSHCRTPNYAKHSR